MHREVGTVRIGFDLPEGVHFAVRSNEVVGFSVHLHTKIPNIWGYSGYILSSNADGPLLSAVVAEALARLDRVVREKMGPVPSDQPQVTDRHVSSDEPQLMLL